MQLEMLICIRLLDMEMSLLNGISFISLIQEKKEKLSVTSNLHQEKKQLISLKQTIIWPKI
jgi:hypothetical protein